MENEINKTGSPKLMEAHVIQAKRVVQLEQLYRDNPDLMERLSNAWVGKTLLRADLTALINLLIQKGIIAADEFLSASTLVLDKFLFDRQIELEVIITPDGCYREEKNGG